MLEQTVKTKTCWTNRATLCLLSLYKARKSKFESPRFKNRALWTEISDELRREGHQYDADQAEGRWKTLLAAYRRVVDHNNKSGNDRKEMVFYEEVESIVGDNPTVSPRITISSSDGVKHRQKQAAAKRKIANLQQSSPPADLAQPGCLQPARTTASPSAPTGSGSPSSSHSGRAAASCDDPQDDSSSESSTLVPSKKRKHPVNVRPKKKAAQQTEMMTWLQTAEEARVQLAERIHADNMTVMNGLLDVLKQMTNKNST